MAKLRVMDKVGLGELIIKAAQDDTVRKSLKDYATEMLSKFVVVPPDRKDANGQVIKHRIEVIEDTQDVTYIVLPWKEDVDRAMDRIDDQNSVYPLEYRPGAPEYIDDSLFPRKALYFRFGEYMFGRCR